MGHADWRRIIASEMQALLKPLGYRRKQFEFSCELSEVIHYISQQSSAGTTAMRLRVTVNLGVLSKSFTAEANVWVPPPGLTSCLWRRRLGQLTPLRDDRWWTVDSDTSANHAAAEICSLLSEYGIPALAKLETGAALEQALKLQSHPAQPKENAPA
jgi:hypothetical protein